MKYKLIEKLKKAKHVCLIAHTEPDADALCSMVVLKHFLVEKFKLQVDIFAEYTHLPQSYFCVIENQNINQGKHDYDFAVMMDAPTTERLGKFKNLFEQATNKLVIDHHATNEFDKSTNLIDVVSSTCEIVFDILNKYKYKFSKRDYGMIYAGIITDTNNLTVGERSKHTFDVVGECVQNVESYPIYENFMLNNTRLNMNLMAKAIQNAQYFCDDKIIISHITSQQAKEMGAMQDSYTGIINRLATINGAKMVGFIYPKQDEFYVSMRGRVGCNVGEVAKQNGGGGHAGAAAFMATGDLSVIEQNLLQNLTKQLDSQTDESHNVF